MKALQTGHPDPLHVIAQVAVATHVRAVEKHIHAMLQAVCLHGEWFDITLDVTQLESLVVQALDSLPPPPTPMTETLGSRIRALRKRYGMPAAVLADRVRISRQQLYFIEGNKTLDPGALTVLRIAEELGVSTDYLLKGTRKVKRLADDVEMLPTLSGMA
jgi:DNA-binding XRE family transcriptional regulator